MMRRQWGPRKDMFRRRMPKRVMENKPTSSDGNELMNDEKKIDQSLSRKHKHIIFIYYFIHQS
jgi:hypothetical protein